MQTIHHETSPPTMRERLLLPQLDAFYLALYIAVRGSGRFALDRRFGVGI